PRFDPAAVGGTATFVSLVPTMLTRLLDAGYDLGGFRRILLGGGPIDPALRRRAAAAGAAGATTYGLTETRGRSAHDGHPFRAPPGCPAAPPRAGVSGWSPSSRPPRPARLPPWPACEPSPGNAWRRPRRPGNWCWSTPCPARRAERRCAGCSPEPITPPVASAG